MRWHDTRVRLLSRAVGELTALTVDELMLATGLESLDTANPLVLREHLLRADLSGRPARVAACRTSTHRRCPAWVGQVCVRGIGSALLGWVECA